MNIFFSNKVEKKPHGGGVGGMAEEQSPFPWRDPLKNMNCNISSLHQCHGDKEADADLHFDHGMTIPRGIK